MHYKDAAEQKMVATFANHIISALVNQPGGIETLKEVFIASLLTPQDVLAQAHRMQLRSGDVQSAIYEDIIYALYVEIRDNKASRVVEAVYDCAVKFCSNNKKYQREYNILVKKIKDGMDDFLEVGENAFTSHLYFSLLHDGISMGPKLHRSMIAQYQFLLKTRPIDAFDSNYSFLCEFTFDSTPIEDSKVYQESKKIVIQSLVEYLKQRYSSSNISEENVTDFIAKHIHFGIHNGTKPATSILDEIGCQDESVFSALSWLGVEKYHFSQDILLAVMGDATISSYGKCINYHPDIMLIIELAYQSYLRPYTTGKHETLTRAILRKEILPRITSNIEAFYERIVTMYYVDCIYKVVEQYRDKYYYNFPWFYDIEKQDAKINTPVEPTPQLEPNKEDDRYSELNAQYERERKRIRDVCKKHAHELAEKDKALAEQLCEIEKLQNQLQIQQEFINLANAVEEPDVKETLDISRLYGKRFLFVGKLYESNAKLKQDFPASTFMETETANIKSLKVDGVVFLIRNMGHSMYYKVMQNNQFAELPKIYCNSRNINNIYQAMLQGIENVV